MAKPIWVLATLVLSLAVAGAGAEAAPAGSNPPTATRKQQVKQEPERRFIHRVQALAKKSGQPYRLAGFRGRFELFAQPDGRIRSYGEFFAHPDGRIRYGGARFVKAGTGDAHAAGVNRVQAKRTRQIVYTESQQIRDAEVVGKPSGEVFFSLRVGPWGDRLREAHAAVRELKSEHSVGFPISIPLGQGSKLVIDGGTTYVPAHRTKAPAQEAQRLADLLGEAVAFAGERFAPRR